MSVAASYHLGSLPGFFPLILLGLVVVSIFWTAWDPTYAIVRRYQFQGRAVRVHGKTQYNVGHRPRLHAFITQLTSETGLAARDLAYKVGDCRFACFAKAEATP